MSASLLLDYGFNIMDYRVIENHETYFLVLSKITEQIYKIEKNSEN